MSERIRNTTVNASITIFMSMSILMIAALGFTLLEVSRFYGAHEKAKQVSDAVADSTFSEYILPMWEQYGILAIDMAHGTDDEGDTFLKERILEFANKSTEADIDYFYIEPTDIEVKDAMRLTDNDGEAFIHEAATFYKSNIGSELLELLSNNADETKSYQDCSWGIDECIGKGNKAYKDSLENASKETMKDEKSQNENNKPSSTSLSEAQVKKGETMMDDVSEFKSKGVLEQVIPGDVEVSNAVFNVDNAVSKRDLVRGNSPNSSKATSVDKVIFSIYLKDKFQHFGKNLGHNGLQYELEYIVAGNDSDVENLKGVVGRLLAVREAANFVAIIKDPVKKGAALELATAIGSVSLNPVVVEVIQYGIIAAWSYMESVLDVRLLLEGGRISPVKSSEDWTCELYNIAAVVDVNYKAKNCDFGMNYEDYLMSFLILDSNKTISLRALDMIENSMNATQYYENLKMDHLICDMDFKMNYIAEPMYFSLVSLDVVFLDLYKFGVDEYRSYL